jgi:hypothetical protein
MHTHTHTNSAHTPADATHMDVSGEMGLFFPCKLAFAHHVCVCGCVHGLRVRVHAAWCVCMFVLCVVRVRVGTNGRAAIVVRDPAHDLTEAVTVREGPDIDADPSASASDRMRLAMDLALLQVCARRCSLLGVGRCVCLCLPHAHEHECERWWVWHRCCVFSRSVSR